MTTIIKMAEEKKQVSKSLVDAVLSCLDHGDDLQLTKQLLNHEFSEDNLGDFLREATYSDSSRIDLMKMVLEKMDKSRVGQLILEKRVNFFDLEVMKCLVPYCSREQLNSIMEEESVNSEVALLLLTNGSDDFEGAVFKCENVEDLEKVLELAGDNKEMIDFEDAFPLSADLRLTKYYIEELEVDLTTLLLDYEEDMHPEVVKYLKNKVRRERCCPF